MSKELENKEPVDQVDIKNEEAHVHHSFKWKHGSKPDSTFNWTCTEAGTVENSLQNSKEFQRIAKKNNEKELVIIMDGSAISTHFPCCLIKTDEKLTIKYITAAEKRVDVAAQAQSKMLSDKLVTFKVLTEGGPNIVYKVISNKNLKKEVDKISVYGYKDETVKQALQRDGRINNTIFQRRCVLSDNSDKTRTEMSDTVNNLNGKTFQVICLGKLSQSESHTSSSDVNRDPPQQSTASESVNTCTPDEKPMLNSSITPAKSSFHEIPQSENLLKRLHTQFKYLVKQMKTQEEGSKRSVVKDLFHVEYGKNSQTCMEVKMLKNLMGHSNSVCQVRINKGAAGSGFLLFDRFVLTNGHLVKDIYDEESGQLQEEVTVAFSFEDLDPASCATLQVKSVSAFEFGEDVSGYFHDWALLELSRDQTFPDGLLKCFGFTPPSGGICIIGHPEGGVKKIDPCFIIPLDQRGDAIVRHYEENKEYIQLVTRNSFEDVGKAVKDTRQILNYNTCFQFGSSGSPVFDVHCNVVAMHSGGYIYQNTKNQIQSVIEYAYPLSLITEQIILQTMIKGRLDVLKQYLTLSRNDANYQKVKVNVKKIVDSENLTGEIKKVSKTTENQGVLKDFLDFILLKEEPT